MDTGQDGPPPREPAKVAAEKPKSRVRRAGHVPVSELPADASLAAAAPPTRNRIAQTAAVGGGRPTAFNSATVGFMLLIVDLAIVFVLPEPKPFQAAAFITVLGMASALVMNGFLTITLQITTKWLKAGGPIATFVFVCLFAAAVAVPGFGGLASLFTGR